MIFENKLKQPSQISPPISYLVALSTHFIFFWKLCMLSKMQMRVRPTVTQKGLNLFQLLHLHMRTHRHTRMGE